MKSNPIKVLIYERRLDGYKIGKDKAKYQVEKATGKRISGNSCFPALSLKDIGREVIVIRWEIIRNFRCL